MVKDTTLALAHGVVLSLFLAIAAPAFAHEVECVAPDSGSDDTSTSDPDDSDDSNTGSDPDSTYGSDEACSLDGLPQELAGSLMLPEAPNITREVQVSSADGFNTAAAQPGTRIVVTSDIPERVFIAASDIEVINEAFIREVWFCETRRGCQGDSRTGTPQPYGQSIHRIRIQGGVFGHMMFPRPHGNDQRYITDIQIDGAKIDSTLTSTADSAVRVRGKRVMFTDSDLRGEEYSLVSLHNDPLQTEDLVVRCSTLNSFAPEGVKNEATMRIMNINRSVLTGSILQNGQARTWSDTDTTGSKSKHTFRVHQKSDLIYVGHNQFNNSGVMFGDFGSSAGEIGTIWFIDNTWYSRGTGWFNFNLSAGGSIDAIVARDNNVHREGASGYDFFRGKQDELEAQQINVTDENNQMHEFEFPPGHWLD